MTDVSESKMAARSEQARGDNANSESWRLPHGAPQLPRRDAERLPEGGGHVALVRKAGFQCDFAQWENARLDQIFRSFDAPLRDVAVRRAAKAVVEQCFETRKPITDDAGQARQ